MKGRGAQGGTVQAEAEELITKGRTVQNRVKGRRAKGEAVDTVKRKERAAQMIKDGTIAAAVTEMEGNRTTTIVAARARVERQKVTVAVTAMEGSRTITIVAAGARGEGHKIEEVGTGTLKLDPRNALTGKETNDVTLEDVANLNTMVCQFRIHRVPIRMSVTRLPTTENATFRERVNLHIQGDHNQRSRRSSARG